MGAITHGTIAALSLLTAVAVVQAHQCGQRSAVGAWPWHGAMFHRDEHSAELYLCGVTILTRNFVITSAQCTIDQLGQLQPMRAEQVFVKVGAEQNTEQHDVARIIRHEQYDEVTLENNIALMELKTGIPYSDYVQPICLWQESDSIVSQEGYVVGGGYTEDNDLPKNLKEAKVLVVSREKCISSDPKYYGKHYLESKTFCAGYVNGTITASANSGGGLFVREGNTWFIRGIISNIKYDSKRLKVDLNSYVMFSNVSNYASWIINYVKLENSIMFGVKSRVDDNEEPEISNVKTTPVSEQTKPFSDPKNCGQKQLPIQSSLSNGYNSQVGAWPWHGALFHRNYYVESYACGVTILTDTFVITTAQCTIDLVSKHHLSEDRVFVKVGLTNLDAPEKYVQQLHVTRIIRHEDYETATVENSVALVQLTTGITFGDYVQPICLWKGDTDLMKIVSQVGYIVGWEHSEDYGLPTELKESTMLVVSREECIDIDPSYFRGFDIESDTFCAAYRNESIVAGDSGSGLYLRQGNNWALRGIFSNVNLDSNAKTVDPEDLVVFLDASYYLEWIEAHLSHTSGRSESIGISTTSDPIISIGNKVGAAHFICSFVFVCVVVNFTLIFVPLTPL